MSSSAGRGGSGKPTERRAKKKGRTENSDDDDSDSDDGLKYAPKDRRLDDETEEALDEFAFLEGAGHGNAGGASSKHPPRARQDDWNPSAKKLEQIKEQYKSEKRTKRSMNSQDDPNLDHTSAGSLSLRFLCIGDTRKATPLVADTIDIPADGRIDIEAIQGNFNFTVCCRDHDCMSSRTRRMEK